MLTFLLAARKKNTLKNFAELLRRRHLNVHQAFSESASLEILQSQDIDVVIAMIEDLPLVKQLIAAFPMVNYALAGSLDHQEFHHVTEGYGILMQLPLSPSDADITVMLDQLAQIKALSFAAGGGTQ